MHEPTTILLAPFRPALAAAVTDAMPGPRVLPLEQRPPSVRIDGRVWCFVDWLLPEVSGIEMCRRLREAPATAHAQITMVLDEDDAETRRRALRAGADDYLVGPLLAGKLIERLQQYRAGGSKGMATTRVSLGGLTVDLGAHQARWNGRPVPLRPNELRLLAHFLEHPDQVFSRASLIAMLGKDDQAIDERTVDVWIGRLRRALRAQAVPDPLRTVRSMGYVLDTFESEGLRAAS